MQKNIFNIPVFILILLIGLVVSCSEEPEPELRTREMEWAELDSIIRNLEADGLDVDTTDRLVFYIVRKPGEGPTPKQGDVCSVEYWGYFNNRLFDDSKIFNNNLWVFPYQFKKEVHEVLGLIDVIGYMNQGAEVDMYIPSDLAYGSKGKDNIPPYTTLFYKAKMHHLEPQ
ncbi:MAG TPA: hypothetical protein ENN90_09110 [Mariniphaga anaerophila]|uniref:Peptidyl-prolyl cis-trans isomerase n=1 Tax=Mariniphaga anaerophila TaxID=1484053 RepID=A0A831PLZ1_9BACT|nr:hypothetical protein [Mariniphaga anaerophila]